MDMEQRKQEELLVLNGFPNEGHDCIYEIEDVDIHTLLMEVERQKCVICSMQLCLLLITLSIGIYFTVIIKLSPELQPYAPLAVIQSQSNPFDSIPHFDLMCRTYWDSIFEIMRFMFSYQLFWPHHELTNQIVFVLDDESEADHQMGEVLEAVWGKLYRVKAYTEKWPEPGTLLAKPIGYFRSQYSNFYSDQYSNAEYIAIIDTDAELFRRPNPDDLFVHNKPIMRFISAHKPPQGHDFYLSTEWLIGRPYIGNFMVTFPVIIKRAHFHLLRTHILSHHPEFDTFEQVWGEMNRRFDNHFGNFMLIGNYLFHYHYDEYEWRMEYFYMDLLHPPGMLNSDRYRYPTPYLMKHLPYTYADEKKSLIQRLYANLCVNSDFLAVGCHRITDRADVIEHGYRWLWTPEWPTIYEELGLNINIAEYIDNPSWQDRSRQLIQKNLNDYHGKELWLSTQFDPKERVYKPQFSKKDRIQNATLYQTYPPLLEVNP